MKFKCALDKEFLRNVQILESDEEEIDESIIKQIAEDYGDEFCDDLDAFNDSIDTYIQPLNEDGTPNGKSFHVCVRVYVEYNYDSHIDHSFLG